MHESIAKSACPVVERSFLPSFPMDPIKLRVWRRYQDYCCNSCFSMDPKALIPSLNHLDISSSRRPRLSYRVSSCLYVPLNCGKLIFRSSNTRLHYHRRAMRKR